MDRERWGSLVWLFFGVLISWGSFRLRLGDFRNPGPGFLPFITGVILIVLSLIVFVQSRGTGGGAGRKPFLVNRRRAWKATLTLAALLVYAVAMNYLGFLVST